MEENRKENIKNTPNVQAGEDMQTPHKRRVRYKRKIYRKNLRKNIRNYQPRKIRRYDSKSY